MKAKQKITPSQFIQFFEMFWENVNGKHKTSKLVDDAAKWMFFSKMMKSSSQDGLLEILIEQHIIEERFHIMEQSENENKFRSRSVDFFRVESCADYECDILNKTNTNPDIIFSVRRELIFPKTVES